MYGAILVEPVGGLKKVDKEFYVVQSEFYTKEGKKGETLEFSFENGLMEHPSHVVFNGNAQSLIKNPLKAKVGDTIRMFYINAGPNHVASWHIIGEIFDRVYPEGSLTTAPLESLQTTVVPAGGSSMAEFKVEVPGTYLNVDHSIIRINCLRITSGLCRCPVVLHPRPSAGPRRLLQCGRLSGPH